MSARLAVESFAARAASKLSRLAGTGGGTTLPGKLLWKLDPGAIDALAARLPDGTAVVSATNGKTTTTAMAAEILEPGRKLAWNRSGANLVSGIASILLAERSIPRMRFTLARALGHLLANREEAMVDLQEERKKTPTEGFATAFASALLMPARGLRERFGAVHSEANEVGDIAVLLDTGRRGQISSVFPGDNGHPLYCVKLPRGRRVCVHRDELEVVLP